MLRVGRTRVNNRMTRRLPERARQAFPFFIFSQPLIKAIVAHPSVSVLRLFWRMSCRPFFEDLHCLGVYFLPVSDCSGFSCKRIKMNNVAYMLSLFQAPSAEFGTTAFWSGLILFSACGQCCLCVLFDKRLHYESTCGNGRG